MSDEYSRISTNSGHGHIWERPDGMKARCGGAGMCSQCAIDKALYDKFVSEKAANSESNDVCLQNSKVKAPTSETVDVKAAMDEFASNFIKEWVDQPIQDGWHHLYQVVVQDTQNQAAELSQKDKRIAELEGAADALIETINPQNHSNQKYRSVLGKLNNDELLIAKCVFEWIGSSIEFNDLKEALKGGDA